MAWVLIIVEVYIFFDVILPFAPPIHELGSFTLLALLKVGATLGLGALWFALMTTLAELYTSSKLRSQTPKPSS